MTLKYRQLVSNGGPDTRAAWAPMAHTSTIPLTLMTDGLDYPLYVVPPTSLYSTQANAPMDIASSSGYIQTLTGIYITSDTVITANISSNIYFSVYRADAQVGSARIAGWSTGATAALAVLTPKAVPFNTANTTALFAPPNGTLSATAALCPLKPLDVITVEYSDVDASGLSGVNLIVSLDIQ